MNEKNPNYMMPAEWEPHEAIWLAWPYDEITFPDRVEQAEDVFVEMIKALEGSERVELLVLDEEMKKRAREKLAAGGVGEDAVIFRETDYADVWLRDTGPIFVRNGSGGKVLTKWIFNSWGGKFPELLKDGEIPGKIARWKNLPLVNAEAIVEGGAIDVNGAGVCLTTEQCLLNENRNPGMTKADVEKFLGDYLGVSKTIWLGEGLLNDHTDGHIDELARFVSPGTIVCAFEDDEDDENYATLRANYERLSAATDLDGKPFNIIKLPMPHVTYDDGEKAPVSYTNFYIGNTVVLAPVFNDENDRQALEILAQCFPGRKLVPIDCSDIIYGGGAVHCMTQQEPL
ncbi:MAG: agmatine/peptidylarginine deiminase [Candidatus Dadabacteria bacterium]